MVTVFVPKSPEKHFCTVLPIFILIFVKGGEFLIIVLGQRVTCKEEHHYQD